MGAGNVRAGAGMGVSVVSRIGCFVPNNTSFPRPPSPQTEKEVKNGLRGAFRPLSFTEGNRTAVRFKGRSDAPTEC
jgi:hypothetical protein